MNAITVTRNDDAQNMHRYFQLDVQRDLFGAWRFIRKWDRIGRAGEVRTVHFPSPAEAQAALDRQRYAKVRRGYA
jgi:predicted DNA-binding WGR domain protein